MVDFDISHDFSVQDEGIALSPLQQTLARTFGKKYIDGAEVKDLLTNDGKKLTARLSYHTTSYGIKVRQIHLAPAPGSHITNIDTLMKKLRKTDSAYIIRGSGNEEVIFTRQHEYGDVEYSICTRTPAPDKDTTKETPAKPATSRLEEAAREAILPTGGPKQEEEEGEEYRIRSTMTPEEMRAAVADLDDTPEGSGTKVKDAEKEKPKPTRVPKTLEEIAGYSVVGERNDGEFYARHDRALSDETVSALQATIKAIRMTEDGNPLVAYTTIDGVVTKADLFPPKGAAITYIEFEKEVILLKEQKPGMIRVSRGPTEIVVHRKHLDEKYDIMGEIYSKGELSGRNPSPEEVDVVNGFLAQLPIIIRSSDDTEANVAYTHPFTTERSPFSLHTTAFRLIFMPKGKTVLYIVGLEEAKDHVRDRSLAERRVKDIEMKIPGSDSTFSAVVFTTSNYARNWEHPRGAEKDFFERFYEQHQEMQRQDQ
ncbi:hypothetical protein HZB90_01330 [archaeon]|nr:hypothetical protein [archaeon]